MRRAAKIVLLLGLGVAHSAFAEVRVVDPVYLGEDRIAFASERHGAYSFAARAVGRVLDARTVVQIEQTRSCYFSWFRNCGSELRQVEEGVWVDRIDDKSCQVSERSLGSGVVKSPEIHFHSWKIPCARPQAVPAFSFADRE